jgi:hypothetical protein
VELLLPRTMIQQKRLSLEDSHGMFHHVSSATSASGRRLQLPNTTKYYDEAVCTVSRDVLYRLYSYEMWGGGERGSGLFSEQL